MNILITGANGFIGAHLRKAFTGQHTVYSIVRKQGEDVPLNCYGFDLADTATVKRTITADFFEQQIDVIIHCAAVLSTAAMREDITVFYQNNAITESLIHVARMTRPTRLINLSTIGVYPNLSGVYTENSMVAPGHNNECLYSLSKLCSEELLSFYLGTQTEVVNLRLGQTYGEGMREDRIYSIMLQELNQQNQVTVWGNGERISNFISINYLLEMMGAIVSQKSISGTFNLGEQNISYRELAESIIRSNGNAESKIVLKAEGITSKVYIDSSKLAMTLHAN